MYDLSSFNMKNKKKTNSVKLLGLVLFLTSSIGYFFIFTSFFLPIKSFLLGFFGLSVYVVLFLLGFIGSALFSGKKIFNSKVDWVYASLLLALIFLIFTLIFNGVDTSITYGEFLIDSYVSKMTIGGMFLSFLTYPMVYFLGKLGSFIFVVICLVVIIGLWIDYRNNFNACNRNHNIFKNNGFSIDNETVALNEVIKSNKNESNKFNIGSKKVYSYDTKKQNNNEISYLDLFDASFKNNDYEPIFNNEKLQKNSSQNFGKQSKNNNYDFRNFNNYENLNLEKSNFNQEKDKNYATSFIDEEFSENEKRKKDLDFYNYTFNGYNDNVKYTSNIKSKDEINSENYFNGVELKHNESTKHNVNSKEDENITLDSGTIRSLLDNVFNNNINTESFKKSSLEREDVEYFVETNRALDDVERERNAADILSKANDEIYSNNSQRNKFNNYKNEVKEKNNITNQNNDYGNFGNENNLSNNQKVNNVFSDNFTNLETTENINFSYNENLEDNAFQLKQKRPYVKPPIDLLRTVNVDNSNMVYECEEKSRKIEETLATFNIPSKVINYIIGPAVTRYELEIQPGISINKIANHQSDIEYAVASNGKIIIQTPVPGKSVVGIEVPNSKVSLVSFKELIASKEFLRNKFDTAFVVGRDLNGDNIICNIEEMPHILIAGTTGSGKSVFMHAIIISLIYKSLPDDLRFIMIDPKQELSRYAGIPHLLHKVPIKNSSKAVLVFDYLIEEMTDRYDLFAIYGCRDVDEYNRLPQVESGDIPKKPKIVVFVDEFAELIAVGKKELEDKIIRIAQAARACGIYLIIATQRPTANIITGTLKGNLPARVAFRVLNNIDSRVVIDMVGAEKLLGKGDMLYFPNGKMEPSRVQACYVDSSEITAVVNFVKENNDAYTDQNLEKLLNQFEGNSNSMIDMKNDNKLDPLLPACLRYFIENKTLSISSLQRNFGIGFPRAGKIFDQLIKMKYITVSKEKKCINIDMETFIRIFGDVGA